MEQLIRENFWFIYVFTIIALWDTVWKMLALWRAARNKQAAWYVCIAVLNTAGFLPIIYLLWFRKKQQK